MNIITLNLQDGLGLIEVVVGNLVTAVRLQAFMVDAKKAMDTLEIIETGEDKNG